VLLIAVQGSTPDRVRLLVITKDIWSLRLNWSPVFVGNSLQSLVLQPAEQNVFGTHHQAALDLQILPKSYFAGAGYGIPWLFGSRTSASLEAGLWFATDNEHAEGSHAAFHVGRPLFSASTEWGWGAGVAYDNQINRRYEGADIATFSATSGAQIPWQYRSEIGDAEVGVVRSTGYGNKLDVTVGFSATARAYRPYEISATPADLAQFQSHALPQSDTRVGPFGQIRVYQNTYVRTLNVEVLALQEDYRLGPDFIARVYPVLEAFGSTRTLVGFSAGLADTWMIGDGLGSASLESMYEWARDYKNGQIEARLRLVSPRFILGRLVFDVDALIRYADDQNVLSYLGGDTRPRGYPTQYFYGQDAFASTIEFRSTPLEIFKSQWAGVLFYDVGTTYLGIAGHASNVSFVGHSVGTGLRVVFPQLDRWVFRLDLAAPIALAGLPAGVQPLALSLTVGQAFDPISVVARNNRTLLATPRYPSAGTTNGATANSLELAPSPTIIARP
jgi:hypothetical protein